MKKLSNKRKAAIIASWAFVLVCLIIIFMYSNETASESSETSDGVISKLLALFNLSLSSGVVRAVAHGIEFAGLCFALNLAFFSTYLKFSPLLSFLSTAFYSATDEIHQFFIEGRACQVIDLVIDASGALITVLVLSAIYYLYKQYCRKRGKLCQY